MELWEGSSNSPSEGWGRWHGESDFEGLTGITSWGRHLRQKEHWGEGTSGRVPSPRHWGKGAGWRVAGGAGFTFKGPSILSMGAWAFSYRNSCGRFEGASEDESAPLQQAEGSMWDTRKAALTLSCQHLPHKPEPKAVARQNPPCSP